MNAYAACIVAAVFGFGIAYGLGFLIIPLLRKFRFGTVILEIGPKWHKEKQGTPTMGGVLFIVATVFSFLILVLFDKAIGGDIVGVNKIVSASLKLKVWGGIVMALGFAFIGFLDDYVKVKKRQNLGLTVKQKSAMQFVMMLGYLLTLFMNDPTGSMFVPFLGMVETGPGFWLLGMAVIYCTVNAVNFTDGVDGLCASVTFTAAVSFIVIAALRNCMGASLLASALAGSLIGYFIWNKFPAKVMMGDTGSMFLGGTIVALSYAVDCPLIILFCGIIYVIEFSSDIIQIIYFKATNGKRIFKMAPLHHHFELCGWKENKIVAVFSAVNILGGALGIVLTYFGNLR